MNVEVIVLAAGQGTRMRSDLPKVLHFLAGRPLLAHVLDTVRALQAQRIHVVFGHGGERLRETFDGAELNWVHQAQQLGTGHAVGLALPHVLGQATVLVVYGDTPLLQPTTLDALLARAGDGLALLTARPDSPTGYGRIVRDPDGVVCGIVEERDATPDQRLIEEVNTGVMASSKAVLAPLVAALDTDNAQGEYYLTDVVALAVDRGVPVRDAAAGDPGEILGVNTKTELAAVEAICRRRNARRLMEAGVTVLDPDRVDVRGATTFGRDCVVDVNVILEGTNVIGDRVAIGPNTILSNVELGDDVVIHANCVIEQAVVAQGAAVGPFARLRPGTEAAPDARIGNFVEIKNSRIGPGAKVNHLSYVGDSSVGRDSNIGAGVITCNYDGAAKHRTEIGERVFVGSDCQLVAPVRIGDGATIGAGSTITSDVPEGNLAVSRARQRQVPGWRRPQKK